MQYSVTDQELHWHDQYRQMSFQPSNVWCTFSERIQTRNCDLQYWQHLGSPNEKHHLSRTVHMSYSMFSTKQKTKKNYFTHEISNVTDKYNVAKATLYLTQRGLIFFTVLLIILQFYQGDTIVQNDEI